MFLFSSSRHFVATLKFLRSHVKLINAGMLGRSYRASPHGGDNVSYCAALHETLSYFINYFGQFCVCVKFKCKPK